MQTVNWIQALRCPRCAGQALQWGGACELADEAMPAQGGLACSRCGARYPVAPHWLDLREGPAALTLAGRSNQAPLAPALYERLWRPRSMRILSGGRTDARAELQLLRDWAPLSRRRLALDLGSATGLYARTLAATEPAATVVALDLAPNMLQASYQYAKRAGVRNIAHVCAPADRLPFAAGTVDIIVCGGSLNEFASMSNALREARRVLAAGGHMFIMSLGAAQRGLGALAQRGARAGGIQFPTATEFDALVLRAGFTVERQQAAGVVTFSLLRVAVPGTAAQYTAMEAQAA